MKTISPEGPADPCTESTYVDSVASRDDNSELAVLSFRVLTVITIVKANRLLAQTCVILSVIVVFLSHMQIMCET